MMRSIQLPRRASNSTNTTDDKTHNVVEPKSRLNLQAADRETSLVRGAISTVLLLKEVLLKLLLGVWQVDTRGETKVVRDILYV